MHSTKTAPDSPLRGRLKATFAASDANSVDIELIQVCQRDVKIRTTSPIAFGSESFVVIENTLLDRRLARRSYVHYCQPVEGKFEVGLWLYNSLPYELIGNDYQGFRGELRYLVNTVLPARWPDEMTERVFIRDYSRNGVGLYSLRPIVPGEALLLLSPRMGTPIAIPRVRWQCQQHDGVFRFGCRLQPNDGITLADCLCNEAGSVLPNDPPTADGWAPGEESASMLNSGFSALSHTRNQ